MEGQVQQHTRPDFEGITAEVERFIPKLFPISDGPAYMIDGCMTEEEERMMVNGLTDLLCTATMALNYAVRWGQGARLEREAAAKKATT